MPRPLEEAVVVITGARSGIGRAAALRIAKQVSALVGAFVRGTTAAPGALAGLLGATAWSPREGG